MKNTEFSIIRVVDCSELQMRTEAVDAAARTDRKGGMSMALSFPKNDFQRKEVTAHTRSGDNQVVYRAYEHVPYVTTPAGPADTARTA